MIFARSTCHCSRRRSRQRLNTARSAAGRDCGRCLSFSRMRRVGESGMRRGSPARRKAFTRTRLRPTAHIVHGSRAAIAAGVSMIPLAVAVARDSLAELNVAPERARRAVAALLEGAGGGGMIGGQLRDLAGEGRALTVDDLEAVHAAKTGALIAASARMGAIAAGAGDDAVAAVERYGRSIGLAFQIMDDVLDQTSTTFALGKTAGRDRSE